MIVTHSKKFKSNNVFNFNKKNVNDDESFWKIIIHQSTKLHKWIKKKLLLVMSIQLRF